MTSEYILGSSDHEVARLALQQEVWRENTSDFLDRLGVGPGARVVDLGCGPGHVVAMLRERVGSSGEVLAVDEAPRWVEHVESRARAEGWHNVRVLRSRIQELSLEEGSIGVLFLRWVLGFLPQREQLLRRLARFLKPGGVLAVMDYNHEGVSIFPRSSGFDAVIRATRAYYETKGGDTFVMGDVQRLFRAAGLEPTVLRCYVISGGPASPAMRWADAFFPYHADGMVDAGVMSREDRTLFLAEWKQRLSDPDALFFSPIVVGAAARKT